MSYVLVKAIHQIAIVSSLCLFSIRAGGSLLGAIWPKHRIARILQHTNDTVLLGSALTLVFMAGINPLHAPWLMVKILGLVIYIALGTFVMQAHTAKLIRLGALLLAMLLYGFIVSVALSKSPAGIVGHWYTG